MSGSFGETYGEEDFIVHFDNRRHKIYKSVEQADRLFSGFRHRFLWTMNRKSPALHKLLSQARAHKLPLSPVNLRWPEILIASPEELAALKPSSFPLILALVIQPDSGGLYQIKLGMTSPPDPAKAGWLMDELKTLLEAGVAEGTPVNLSAYARPRVIHQAERYSLYAGGLFCAKEAARQFYEAQLQALVDELAPKLDLRLASPDFEKETGTRLALLAPALAKSQRKNEDLYNPRGPAVDEEAGVEFVRPVFENGHLVLRVLTAPEQYNWGAFSMKMEAWMAQAIGARKVEKLEGK